MERSEMSVIRLGDTQTEMQFCYNVYCDNNNFLLGEVVQRNCLNFCPKKFFTSCNNNSNSAKYTVYVDFVKMALYIYYDSNLIAAILAI